MKKKDNSVRTLTVFFSMNIKSVKIVWPKVIIRYLMLNVFVYLNSTRDSTQRILNFRCGSHDIYRLKI